MIVAAVLVIPVVVPAVMVPAAVAPAAVVPAAGPVVPVMFPAVVLIAAVLGVPVVIPPPRVVASALRLTGEQAQPQGGRLLLSPGRDAPGLPEHEHGGLAGLQAVGGRLLPALDAHDDRTAVAAVLEAEGDVVGPAPRGVVQNERVPLRACDPHLMLRDLERHPSLQSRPRAYPTRGTEHDQ